MLDVYANAEDGVAPRIIARMRAGRVEALDEKALPEVTQAARSAAAVMDQVTWRLAFQSSRL